MHQGSDDEDRRLRLLLVGKTGSGKSATGNAIFNDQVFVSEVSSSSVTRVCQTHTGAVDNRSVTVIDTPDFIFSTHTDFDPDSELKKALTAPGVNIILLILSFSTFTKQEQDFVSRFEQKFGAEALRFTVVLFTHADKTHVTPLREMIRRNNELSDFINRCGQRYQEFNIKAPANRRQVTELMEKIDRLVSENTNACYTLEMMEENERRREEERERERQMRLDRLSVRREYEEQERLDNPDKARKSITRVFLQQIKLKNVSLIVCLAVGTGGVSVWKKDSSQGWTFIKGFCIGGSAAAAGVFSGILCGWVHSKSQFVRICSSEKRPSAVGQFVLKTAIAVCGAVSGAAIGHVLGGNVRHIAMLSALAGAVMSVQCCR